MTGFARVQRNIASGEMVLSIKSVNHRGLDLHFHMPAALDGLESELRNVIKNGVSRGHLQIHLSLARSAAGGDEGWNRGLLETYLQAFREAAEKHQLGGQPDLNAALSIPGMLSFTSGEEELEDDVQQAVLAIFAEGVAALNLTREREGAALVSELRPRCRSICDLVGRMQEIRAGAVHAFQERLRERLSDLLRAAGLDPQRLAQEAAILADRSDISEELVRLRTHTDQLEKILQAGGEVGKRLDFLLQEMNRETNTILSKTGGLGDLGLTITDLALSSKSEIDKIREQALNLE
jgi:uncharacterized protein (TIGR00255 family)